MLIHTLDLKFQGHNKTVASYLIVGPTGLVLVETGPMSTLPELKDRLAEHGLHPEDIGHVLVTHIHLDHAGAAGWWAQEGAQVYVHHVGAPHLIDPGKLLTSAARIYGDQMDMLWGEMLPAPAENVTALHDGDIVKAGGLSFLALDTPGHAYHHHVYLLDNIAFTGDAASIHIPISTEENASKQRIPFVALSAPPPEFHLRHWQKTIKTLLGQPIEAIYPTHFGRVDNWREHLEALDSLLVESTEFVRVRLEAGLDRDTILSDYIEWHLNRGQKAGLADEVLSSFEALNPQFMSVDGIIRYLKKQAQKDTV